ncbi:unnamed protein product [Cylicocyclus nassatus]|uniref:DUF7083 domain-containing protein n=1 Tax=Cylicocyclus nassatus TaxID=53992 RepID=A0AA36M8U0_CYLNA|nr:unnamed protein product [Cylicocyclus nassatus]
MDPTQFLMLQIMELWKEVKKKQGSSEDYVMNALATRLPEFNHDPENGCTFDVWLQRYENIIKNDGAALDDNAKARLIVSRLDQKTHARLANTIAPKKIEDMDLQTTKATLLKLFGCRKSVFTRRYECMRMKYHSSMPLSDFVAEVNRNVENAEFAAMTGEQFKCLIFVSALEDDDCVALRTHVLKKMKAEPDTTLMDLLEECNDYSELQSHIEMIGKAKVPQVHAIQRDENPQVNAMQRGEKRKSSTDQKPKADLLCQLVYVKDYRTVNKTAWIPGIICKQIGDVTYEVKVDPGIWIRHADQIKARASMDSTAEATNDSSDTIPPKPATSPQAQLDQGETTATLSAISRPTRTRRPPSRLIVNPRAATYHYT